MTLLYLAVAYIVGIGLGKWVWDYGLLGCDLPSWSWWIPFSLLLFAPLLHRWEMAREVTPAPALRWPVSAGFVPPRPTLSWSLSTALLLCLLMGLLRYATHPQPPCWTPTDLAYYNLPASRAFDRDAPRLTVQGYIDNYPSQEDGRQQLYVAIEKVMVGNVAQLVHGKLLAQIKDRHRYLYGETVHLVGRLVTPPDFDEFSYREYLARSGIHSLLHDAQVETQNEALTMPTRGL